MHWTLARSLRDARALIEESPPELVIADLLLPDGRGLELLSSAGQKSSFPVVIMTGHGDEHVAVEAMKAGALHYVVKSESSFFELPQIAERVLCEWRHLEEREEAGRALQASEQHYKSTLRRNPFDVLSPSTRAVRSFQPTILRPISWATKSKNWRGRRSHSCMSRRTSRLRNTIWKPVFGLPRLCSAGMRAWHTRTVGRSKCESLHGVVCSTRGNRLAHFRLRGLRRRGRRPRIL